MKDKTAIFQLEYDDNPNDCADTISSALKEFGLDIVDGEGGDGFQKYIIKQDNNADLLNKTFTIFDIQKAIALCPKFKTICKAEPAVDDSHDSEIEIIEKDMFWFRLLGSNKEKYDEFKKEEDTLWK